MFGVSLEDSNPGTSIDEMLRIAVAHQRDAILITEAERVHPGGRRILFVNPAFTTMTGYSSAEAVGRTPDITVGPETSPEALAAIGAAITTRSPVRLEILKYRKDRSTFWVEIDIAPVFGRRGEAVYFVAMMRDITEKKQQSELLRLQAEALKRASASKSSFLANVSHELRTPLNAIIGFTKLLDQGHYGALNAEQKRSLSRVAANSQHLLKLISELSDVTRIESGKMLVHLSVFDVKDLVDEAIVDLAPLISRSELAVTTRSTRERLVLESDRQKVQQIVLNLLSNALKFTSKGWVRIELGQRADFVTISVVDSGVGIASELQERVFEDYWQVDAASSRAAGGTGLGLAISRRLATMLGGELKLTSEPGKGSRFTLLVPASLDATRTESETRRVRRDVSS